MEKKIRFSLKMDDEVEVRTIEELHNNFSLTKILDYLSNGKLITWLRDRHQTTIADNIEKLDTKNNNDLPRQICEIFEIHNVAFNQDDLYDLLDTQYDTIYLHGDKFEIPLDKENITYIGFNNPIVVIMNTKEEMEKRNIKCLKVQIDVKNITKKIKADQSKKEDRIKAEDFLNTFQTDDFFCFDRLLVTDTAKNFWDEFRKSKEFMDIQADDRFVPQSQKLYDDIVTMLVGRGVTHDSETNFKMVIEYMLPFITNVNSKHYKFVKALITNVDLVRLVQQPIYKRYKVNEDLHLSEKATRDVYVIFIYIIAGLAADSKTIRCKNNEGNGDAGNSTGDVDNDEQDNDNTDDSVDETDDNNENEYINYNKKTKQTGSSMEIKENIEIKDIPLKQILTIAKWVFRFSLEIISEDFIHTYKNDQKMIDRNNRELYDVASDIPGMYKHKIQSNLIGLKSLIRKGEV